MWSVSLWLIKIASILFMPAFWRKGVTMRFPQSFTLNEPVSKMMFALPGRFATMAWP